MALQDGRLPEDYSKNRMPAPTIFLEACIAACPSGVRAEFVKASMAVSSTKKVRAIACLAGRRAVRKTFWLPVVAGADDAGSTWITAAPRLRSLKAQASKQSQEPASAAE